MNKEISQNNFKNQLFERKEAPGPIPIEPKIDSSTSFGIHVVLGLGLSGRGAAELLLKWGKLVVGIDAKIRADNPEIQPLIDSGLLLKDESEPLEWERVCKLIVSPGISPKHPLYRKAVERGIEVIGEADLALPLFKKPLVAVTGTNGKTTVVLMVEHILNKVGISAKAVGNVGISLCKFLSENQDPDLLVVELSSYQLETLDQRVFDAAVLLNVTPDHLDRYLNMQEYAAAKLKLRGCVKEGGVFFVNEQVPADFIPVGEREGVKTFGWNKGVDLRAEGHSICDGDKIPFSLPLQFGRHDIENAMAAWILCSRFGVSPDQFCAGIETFRKPAHRIEFVREFNDVFYYDDSKGTNIDATIQAVKAMRGPVVLIVGGVDKGASYLPWKEHLLGRVRQVIAIGQAAPKIYSELNPYFAIKLADSLQSAVQLAAQVAAKGDCVLLSPGCSSYDMFRDYAQRGEEFKSHVINLGGI